MQENQWSSHNSYQSSHMWHGGQGRMEDTLGGQPEYAMPCEGLQVLGSRGEELKHYRMKILVGHYQHASKCIKKY